VKRLIAFLLFVILGLGVAVAWPFVTSNRAAKTTSKLARVVPTKPSSFHYISMEGASESAFRQAAEYYGLPVPDSYMRTESEGVKCPSHVPSKKGQIFWCQALLEGKLVPVELELTSPLGFFVVARVGENRALWNQIEDERSEESWCSSHPYSAAC
jgi:hypothetical protein